MMMFQGVIVVSSFAIVPNDGDAFPSNDRLHMMSLLSPIVKAGRRRRCVVRRPFISCSTLRLQRISQSEHILTLDESGKGLLLQSRFLNACLMGSPPIVAIFGSGPEISNDLDTGWSE
jgi:hypothetical protein